jgi:Kef-type K+ transport system membrane component KefB
VRRGKEPHKGVPHGVALLLTVAPFFATSKEFPIAVFAYLAFSLMGLIALFTLFPRFLRKYLIEEVEGKREG